MQTAWMVGGYITAATGAIYSLSKLGGITEATAVLGSLIRPLVPSRVNPLIRHTL
ncbi:MAG: hypothetical protein JO182_20655 [Acidobacteriaceae bacterium]|nr:hypothetical protein [Acidobacteriaceae bacterium]